MSKTYDIAVEMITERVSTVARLNSEIEVLLEGDDIEFAAKIRLKAAEIDDAITERMALEELLRRADAAGE